MGDFLSRLVDRSRGTLPAARPVPAPLFAPGPADLAPTTPWQAEGVAESVPARAAEEAPSPATAPVPGRTPRHPEADVAPPRAAAASPIEPTDLPDRGSYDGPHVEP